MDFLSDLGRRITQSTASERVEFNAPLDTI